MVTFDLNESIILYNNREYENYPPHWHTPFEVIMPTEGDYHAICGGHEYLLKENDILIICPGCIHELLAPSNGQRVIFQINFNNTSHIKDIESITALISPCIHLTAAEMPNLYAQIYPLVVGIQRDYQARDPFFMLSIYTKFLQLLTILGTDHTKKIQHLYAEPSRQNEYMDKFIAVCQYITEHCAEKLTLESTAKLAGFSKYHFTRLFKQFTGISFYRYLNLKRIAYAQTLLIDPKVTVTDAALCSGFSSVTSFIRMFKLINHCTPTEFRKMYHS